MNGRQKLENPEAALSVWNWVQAATKAAGRLPTNSGRRYGDWQKRCAGLGCQRYET